MDVKLDFPAAFEPITTLNRERSTSMKEKLLKFSTWICSIGIRIPGVIVIPEEKEGIGYDRHRVARDISYQVIVTGRHGRDPVNSGPCLKDIPGPDPLICLVSRVLPVFRLASYIHLPFGPELSESNQRKMRWEFRSGKTPSATDFTSSTE